MLLDSLRVRWKNYRKIRAALEYAQEKVILKSGFTVFKMEAKAIVRILISLENNHYAKFVEIARISQNEFGSADEIFRFLEILQTPQTIRNDSRYEGFSIVISSTPLSYRRIVHDALENKKIGSPINNMTLEQFLAS
jgi:hypothetical protein